MHRHAFRLLLLSLAALAALTAPVPGAEPSASPYPAPAPAGTAVPHPSIVPMPVDDGPLDPELQLIKARLKRGLTWSALSAPNGPSDVDLEIARYTDQLRLDPSDALAHYHRAVAYEARAIPRDMFALSDLTEAIRINPGLTCAYFARAQVYEVLAVLLWRQEAHPDELGPGDTVPSERVLAFYRLAYDDMITVVRAESTWNGARDRLKKLAKRVTDVEQRISGGALLAQAVLVVPQVAARAAAKPPGAAAGPSPSAGAADLGPPLEYEDILKGRPDEKSPRGKDAGPRLTPGAAERAPVSGEVPVPAAAAAAPAPAEMPPAVKPDAPQ
jgi:hypothetical protein